MSMLVLPVLSLVSLLSCLGAPSYAAIASNSVSPAKSSVVLSVANSDDYIEPTIIDSFVKFVKETDDVDITVNYSVFSTPEEILSKVTAGTANYDLVCNSDYIIQKMLGLNMLEPFAKGAERDALYGDTAASWTDNYEKYASPYLRHLISSITANVNGETKSLGDYARGYMWGTLGLTYNPSFSAYAERGLSKEDVMVQMSDWNAMWDPAYRGTFQIKDSMRDTYSIGLMHVFDAYFKAIRSWFLAGVDGESRVYGKAQYNHDLTVVFNNLNYIDDFNALAKKIDPSAPAYTAESIVEAIQNSLVELKNNSFGLEVDSGKTDITTGDKSGIDTAWSGDAITSMDSADANESNPLALYYSVPLTGGNIWSDNWVMLKSGSLQKQYAQKFVDYLSNPEVASLNMSYIGYTSFIAGDSVLSYVRDTYDPRTAAMYVYSPEDEDYLHDDSGEKVFKDGTGVHQDGKDYGALDMRGSTYAAPSINGAASSWSDYCASEETSWARVDLSYFFNGTFTDYSDDVDSVFYSSEIEEVTGKNLAGEVVSVKVGRQFLAQYPTEDDAAIGTVLDQIPYLAVMEDYGSNSSYVLVMWERVKSSPLPLWGVVVLIVEVALSTVLVVFFFSKKRANKILRQKRREERHSPK